MQLVLIVVEFELEQSVLLLVDYFHPALAYGSFAIAEESAESKERREESVKNNAQNLEIEKINIASYNKISWHLQVSVEFRH